MGGGDREEKRLEGWMIKGVEVVDTGRVRSSTKETEEVAVSRVNWESWVFKQEEELVSRRRKQSQGKKEKESEAQVKGEKAGTDGQTRIYW